jgi:REP element-mobilizing transposase RayT
LSLRGAEVAREVAEAFRDGTERGRFRLAGHALHDDHIHLLVEARDAEELVVAMKSITSLFAHAVNRALRRRGAVLADRYRVLLHRDDGRKRLACGCPVRPAPRPARSARPR